MVKLWGFKGRVWTNRSLLTCYDKHHFTGFRPFYRIIPSLCLLLGAGTHKAAPQFADGSTERPRPARGAPAAADPGAFGATCLLPAELRDEFAGVCYRSLETRPGNPSFGKRKPKHVAPGLISFAGIKSYGWGMQRNQGPGKGVWQEYLLTGFFSLRTRRSKRWF